MSIRMMSWVWENSPYEGTALLVHLALADFANDDRECWPRQELVAQKCRCSVEHVRRVTRRMQDDGFVEITRVSSGPGTSHRYLLKNPTSGGVSGKENPTSERVIPHIRDGNTPHPSPKNRKNRQEPSVTGAGKCPYCKRAVSPGKAHACSASGMLMRGGRK